MTTIVICGDEIACDSMATRGGMIESTKVIKIMRFEEGWIGSAGSLHDIKIMQAFYSGEIEGLPDELNCESLILPDKGKPLCVTVSNGCMIQDVVDNPVCIGSGAPYAYGALHAGATAKEAVLAAISRDCYSGGKVVVKKRGESK